jgi:hypothetical protein
MVYPISDVSHSLSLSYYAEIDFSIRVPFAGTFLLGQASSSKVLRVFFLISFLDTNKMSN